MQTVWNDLRRAEPKATQAPEVTQADSGHCAAPGQPSPGPSPSPALPPESWCPGSVPGAGVVAPHLLQEPGGPSRAAK